MLDTIKRLVERGYTIYATGGTSDFLNGVGVPNIRVYKNEHLDENGCVKQPVVSDLMHRKEIELFVGIPVDTLADSVHDSYYRMRRTAVDLNIPLLTNARLAEAFINAFLDVPLDTLAIKAWDEYK
jgi:carbamoyl-phosphate synthase large subunit